jgi:hypothetical protein
VSVQTRLAAKERQQCSARRSVTSNAQLGCDEVTISLDAEYSQEDSKVIANVVDVLLGINKFIEVCDAIMRQEVMVRRCVQAWARTANVVRAWSSVRMGSITVGGYLVEVSCDHTTSGGTEPYLDTALLRARKSVLCSSIRIRVRVGCRALVFSIKRT